MRVRDRAAGIVVAVELDIAAGEAPQCSHHPAHLRRCRDADRVRDAKPVHHAEPVDGQVHPEKLGLLAAKRVFRAEAQLDAGRLLPDPGQNLCRQVDDLIDASAVAELPEPGGCSDHDVEAVHSRIERHPGVVPVTPDVSEDVRAQAQPGNRLQVGEAARRSLWRGQLQVFHAEFIERMRDRDLLPGRELRVDELLPFAQRGVDDRIVVRWHNQFSS